MPVRIRCAMRADCGERLLELGLVVDEQDAEPPPVLAVDEPVAAHAGVRERGDDLLRDVRDTGIEILGRLVLEVRDFELSCGRSSHAGYPERRIPRPASASEYRDVWLRQLPTFRQLEAVIELLGDLGRMLMAVDAKLDQIVDLLEEDS